MLKTLTDTHFVLNYFISDYLEFCPNDPFLLKVMKEPLQPSKAFRENTK
jgi:hypothetical protein